MSRFRHRGLVRTNYSIPMWRDFKAWESKCEGLINRNELLVVLGLLSKTEEHFGPISNASMYHVMTPSGPGYIFCHVSLESLTE